jgi:kumamolisin
VPHAASLNGPRSTPAAVADPVTGVWVYEGGNWYIVGGTSVASPIWAGIINRAGQFYSSSAAELDAVYSSNFIGFQRINDGACGPYEGYLAGGTWNFCVGEGSPKGKQNK